MFQFLLELEGVTEGNGRHNNQKSTDFSAANCHLVRIVLLPGQPQLDCAIHPSRTQESAATGAALPRVSAAQHFSASSTLGTENKHREASQRDCQAQKARPLCIPELLLRPQDALAHLDTHTCCPPVRKGFF